MEKARNNLFDLQKFLMISFVIITHIGWNDSARKSFLFPYFIDMAVPVFLLISAYLRAAKIEKIGLAKAYSIKEVMKALISLLLAYSVVVVIEAFATFAAFKIGVVDSIGNLSSFTGFIIWVITGAAGPGSYYVPIMVQLILYFPMVYLAFKKNKYFGLAATFLVNLAYELVVYYSDMDPALYRLLIFRYTFLLGLGIFLFLGKEHKSEDIFAMIMLVVGALYITVNHFFYPFPLFQAWKSTSMFCGPFVFGIMYFTVKYYSGLKYSFLCEVGKASYHVYLTQMVYYSFGNPVVTEILGINHMLILVPINLVICIGFGYLFYILEMPIRRKFLQLLQS